MMQCPSCSAPLSSSDARCPGCLALVNPPVAGSSALAPRLVTPQSLDGLLAPPSIEAPAQAVVARPAESSKSSEDDAWRREVLERVRKRRQVRSHALPLFVEGQPPEAVAAPVTSPVVAEPAAPAPPINLASVQIAPDDDEPVLEIPDSFQQAQSLAPSAPASDLLGSLDLPLENGGSSASIMDLPLQAEVPDAPQTRARSVEIPSQSLVERSRPTLVTGPVTRSLVGDLPLVEPSRPEPLVADAPHPLAPAAASPRAASMSDRVQAALIDLGVWSAMTATAFYFASRIARTSIVGLGPAWQGLALFGGVLAAAYVLFFGGLSGATPGKIACGIHVRRFDGSSLGPLASLGRGALGILGVGFFGLGVWPAFWDRDRRTLHDRATDSRVTIA